MSDKIRKLSQAIRFGASLTPQVTKRYVTYNSEGNITGTCALGAAFHGLSIQDESIKKLSVSQAIAPFLKDLTGEERDRIQGTIINLNDNHYWTRERIATWLESHGL